MDDLQSLKKVLRGDYLSILDT